MINSNIFSMRLKTLRESHALSMTELAELLFMKGRDAISKFETGKSKPSMETAMTLSAYFGVSLDWLFGLSNTPYTNDSITSANRAAVERLSRVLPDNQSIEELITLTALAMKIKPIPIVYDRLKGPSLAYFGNYVFLENATFLNDLDHLQREANPPLGYLKMLFTNNKPKRLDKSKIERYKLFIKAHYGYFNEPVFKIPEI